ncbi:SDR family oxidoreductase [bacterium]|nr:SDR family oxidoreductase [bacterium]
MTEFFSLADKVVWITGSARRVGREIALACAEAGADIVVHCRSSRDEAEATAAEITALGRRAILVQGDHAVRADVRRMVEEIDRVFGRLDGLVNSAAVFPRVDFEKATDEDFDRAIDSNLRGAFLCSQLALPLLRKKPPSHIINLVDWSVERPYRRYAAYMAAKGGLATLTKALAKELAPDVRVNSISPGPVLEPADLGDKERDAIIAKTLVNRWGTPRDIVRAAIFLLGSDYITGSDVVVDGGRSLA